MIRPASSHDLPYIDHLQRKNADALSFYPMQVFERESEARRIILAEVDGEPVGYCWHGAPDDICRIHQACIQYDARGRLYGAEIMRWIEQMAIAWNSKAISLRCGADIEANEFWAAMGFSCEAVRPGGIRRSRDINCWTLRLQPELFDFSREPSRRPQSMALWSSQRGSKTASRFHRGKNLAAYRQLFVP